MAELLYTGGVVYPFEDGRADPVEELLVRDGRVVAYGADGELADRATRRVALDGATVLPGLIDTHPHLLHFGSLAESLVPLWDAASHADIVARIAERARRTAPGEWVMASPVGEPHYFIRRSARDLAEGRLPDRTVLDRATENHPVVIQSWAPSLPNVLAFNSMALAKLGIDASTPDRIGHVWVGKDAAGNPTGLLRGSVTNYYSYDDFAHSLWRRIPFLNYDDLVPGTKTAMRAYNALGVTSVYENHMLDKPLLDGYRELRRRDELTLRVLASQEAEAYGMPWSRPREPEDFRRRLDSAAAELDLTDDYFRFNGLSLMWDGTGAVGGVMMCRPYLGPYGERTEGFHNIAPDKAEQVIRFCAERRIRLNVACMGLKAHEECLPLLEAVDSEHDIRSLHWVLVHAQFITGEQVRRYRALGMDVTTSMSFAWGEGHLYAERMGAEELADLSPLRRFFDAGCHLAGGSDWGPKNAFEHIQLALTHEFAGSGHRNLGPAQRINRAEAVRMWTWDAGKVLRWDGIGHLSPGAHADFVIVDRDPLTSDIDDIGKTTVLRTVFDGRTVHDTGELS
ncbi:amidohydrolase [Pseudonocardia acaciae]|uniref:amidohydrolase n=1 Tax=Pseudonocardia acaciae TaxID=551276 RepID=UPI00049183D7|nr:amidohydrolase family protein [Pseudonocardia acaciae]